MKEIENKIHENDMIIAALNEEIITQQKKMIKMLSSRNNYLEEVVALAQEHYHIDLDHPDWPQWEGFD